MARTTATKLALVPCLFLLVRADGPFNGPVQLGRCAHIRSEVLELRRLLALRELELEHCLVPAGASAEPFAAFTAGVEIRAGHADGSSQTFRRDAAHGASDSSTGLGVPNRTHGLRRLLQSPLSEPILPPRPNVLPEPFPNPAKESEANSTRCTIGAVETVIGAADAAATVARMMNSDPQCARCLMACGSATDPANCAMACATGDTSSPAAMSLQAATVNTTAADSCPYANDGQCDVPDYCLAGSDAVDCMGQSMVPATGDPTMYPTIGGPSPP